MNMDNGLIDESSPHTEQFLPPNIIASVLFIIREGKARPGHSVISVARAEQLG